MGRGTGRRHAVIRCKGCRKFRAVYGRLSLQAAALSLEIQRTCPTMAMSSATASAQKLVFRRILAHQRAIAASYTSEIGMTELDKYADLFAEQW